MKKVLLIGYPFPLRQGGSPRLLGLARYLPEFDWETVILTAPLDHPPDPRYRIVETGYHQTLGLFLKLFRFSPDEDIRRQVKRRLGVAARKTTLDRLLTFAGELINYPDSEKGWAPFAIKTGEELLWGDRFDAILSTSAPVTAHVIARKLKKGRALPWVADLRDLWTQNHNYSYSRLRKWFDTRLERKTLGAADALVTVSEPWAEKLGQLHEGKKVYAITNGYDPETVNIPPSSLTAKFSITYTGMIYPGKQDPTDLLEAINSLISEKTVDLESVEIRFYGAVEGWLDGEIDRLGLSGVARQYGTVPRDVALQKQRESQILLLLNWDDPQEKGTIPGKVFEYLAAMRPVLAIGGSEGDVIHRILTETGAGHQAANVESIKAWLKKWYFEYRSRGAVDSNGDMAKIARHSQREMARKFANIFSGRFS